MGCFVEKPEKYGNEAKDNLHVNAHAVISGVIKDRAEGVIPTPHGDIFVHWNKVGDRLDGHIKMPENVGADIEVNGATMFVENGGTVII